MQASSSLEVQQMLLMQAQADGNDAEVARIDQMVTQLQKLVVVPSVVETWAQPLSSPPADGANSAPQPRTLVEMRAAIKDAVDFEAAHAFQQRFNPEELYILAKKDLSKAVALQREATEAYRAALSMHNPLEPVIAHCQRCVAACRRTLEAAVEHVRAAEAGGTTVLEQFTKSDRGSEYLLGVLEVHAVVCRLAAACRANAALRDCIAADIAALGELWQQAAPCIRRVQLATPAVVDALSLERGALTPGAGSVGQAPRICGVCLAPLGDNAAPMGVNKAELAWGGGSYHAACANFSLHLLDPVLTDFGAMLQQ